MTINAGSDAKRSRCLRHQHQSGCPGNQRLVHRRTFLYRVQRPRPQRRREDDLFLRRCLISVRVLQHLERQLCPRRAARTEPDHLRRICYLSTLQKPDGSGQGGNFLCQRRQPRANVGGGMPVSAFFSMDFDKAVASASDTWNSWLKQNSSKRRNHGGTANILIPCYIMR